MRQSCVELVHKAKFSFAPSVILVSSAQHSLIPVLVSVYSRMDPPGHTDGSTNAIVVNKQCMASSIFPSGSG